VEAIIKTLEGGIITKTLPARGLPGGGARRGDVISHHAVTSSPCSGLLEHRLLLYLGNKAFWRYGAWNKKCLF